jgi:hypothetical protein
MEKRAPKNSSDHASDPPVAHYRPADRSPRFLPVVLEEQRIPGRLADAAHRLVDVLGLSAFDARYFRGRSHRVLKQSTSGTCKGSPYANCWAPRPVALSEATTLASFAESLFKIYRSRRTLPDFSFSLRETARRADEGTGGV